AVGIGRGGILFQIDVYFVGSAPVEGLTSQRISEVHVRRKRAGRIESQSLFQGSLCLFPAAEGGGCNSEEQQVLVVGRIKPRGLFQETDGFLVFSHGQQAITRSAQSGLIFWDDLDGLVKIPQSLFQTPGIDLYNASFGQRLEVIRIQANSLVELGQS